MKHGKKRVGAAQRTGVLRLVREGSIRARRRLSTCLRGRKFRIARTAMSHSVHRLGLAGVSASGNERGCTIVASTSSGVVRGCTEILERKFLSISTTRGVIIVGAISNVTKTITTTMSTVQVRRVINSLTKSSAVLYIVHASSSTIRVVGGLQGVMRRWWGYFKGMRKRYVLRGLRIGGLTLVARARMRFGRKLGVLAKRANTNGSVVVNSITLTLKRGIPGRLLQSGRRATLIRLIFSIRGPGILSTVQRLNVRARSRAMVLDHGVASKETVTQVGKRTISTSQLGRITSLLVSVRKRRRRRSLLSEGGRLRVLSTCTGSTLKRGGRHLTTYCRRCQGLGGR